MKIAKNKNIWVKSGYFLLVLLFILVILGQVKLVSAIFSRIVRVIVSWVEKCQSGVEISKKLEFTTFLKDFVSPSPSMPPVLSCTGVRVYTDAVYGGSYADLKPGFYTIGDDPGCGTGALVDSSTGISTGICNDTISSAVVGTNCILSVYEDGYVASHDNPWGFDMAGQGLGLGLPKCSQNSISDPAWDTYAQTRSSFCSDVFRFNDYYLNDSISGILVTLKP